MSYSPGLTMGHWRRRAWTRAGTTLTVGSI